ncbi:hypothetical protein Tco_1484796 [Tanacetum coccineum]
MKDACSNSGNDTQAEGPDIRLSNDTKPLHEVQSTVAYNEDANDRQHAEQPKFINEGKVDQDAEQCLENKTTRVHKENLRATLSEFSVNHICGKEDSSPSSTNELEKESGENTCDNAKSEFQTKFIELEKVLTQQTKDFDDVKLELSNRTAKFEAYFEKLEKTKAVLERQLARKVDDSKAEKDQFLKEINHLRTQLENLKGKSVQTKFDKHSILGKPPADKLTRLRTRPSLVIRGTIEVGVDVVAEINIPDGMLMPDAMEHLEQVEEVVHDIYRHIMEIPLQRLEDIESGQRELEARRMRFRRLETFAVRRWGFVHDDIGDDGENGNGRGNGNGNGGDNGNGNPNRNDRGAMPVTRVVGLTRWFEKMETVFHISNCPEKYQVKYDTCTLLNNALTWWNAHKRTIGADAAFAMSWIELMKLMTKVYCLRNEIQKMESELRQGHYRSDCPKLKNQNCRNKTGNKTNKARGKAYVLGRGEANLDSNVVTGMFLLNNYYDSMLFDSGADRSFVSTNFSALLNVVPSTLDVSYTVDLADRRILETNTVLRGLR